ncbi:hypothetical protein E0Z10_g515 [Xylaria hypoxylon]|uniref:Extracellular membrane protein CFEM domain-containing protein n=1 Tax=Xylaria hypoxylon TaxID=37992 RepID=A0A4Z0ZGW6_9PEZI|nr:hypothetical protein E0Z10_g515 [Xylaria hypoxylon]
MPSMQSTIILATALLGSLLQHAAAAPEASSKRADIEYPQCISTCMRNSGCFDAKCICSKASDGILSDIVICMNQWCSADITAKDLIEPLEGQCDLPKSAVQDAEKKGGVADDTGDDEPSSTSSKSSAKPTATAASTASSKGDDKDDVTVTYDLGKPQTAAAAESTKAATTVTPATSGTLILPTDSATAGGLLTDSDNTPTATGSLGAATSIRATPSSSAAEGDSTGSANEDNAAGLTGRASIFGVVAAMGAALALGF